MEIAHKLKDMIIHPGPTHAGTTHNNDADRPYSETSAGRRASYAIARGKTYMKAETLDDDVPDFTHKLLPFQIKKIQTWFDVMLDGDQDGYITRRDMETMAAKLANIAGWRPESEEATACKDALRSILEGFLDSQQKSIHDGKISRDELVNYIGKTACSAASVKDFPYHVQRIPRLLFSAIGGDKSELTQTDLRNFYRAYMTTPVDDAVLDAYSQRAYRAMTGNGMIPLTLHVYGLVFSNFLLGRSQQTPGKYILPCFDVDGSLDGKRYQINWVTSDD